MGECKHIFCVTCLKKKNEKLAWFDHPPCPKRDCKKELKNFDFKYKVDYGFQQFVKNNLPGQYAQQTELKEKQHQQALHKLKMKQDNEEKDAYTSSLMSLAHQRQH